MDSTRNTKVKKTEALASSRTEFEMYGQKERYSQYHFHIKIMNIKNSHTQNSKRGKPFIHIYSFLNNYLKFPNTDIYRT